MGGSGEAPGQHNHAAVDDLPPRLADDQFYRALASSHRRHLLYCLLETEERTVEELASVLSGWEATAAGTLYTAADRSEVRLQLLHNHLPQLDDAGLIEYDPNSGTVRLRSLQPRPTDIIRQSVEAEQSVESE